MCRCCCRADETAGTGCNADGWLVWSSDDITCGPNQHVLIIGRSDAASSWSANDPAHRPVAGQDDLPTCRDNDQDGGVRCCADTVVGESCDNVVSENLCQLPGVAITLGVGVDTLTDAPTGTGGFTGSVDHPETIIDRSHDPSEWVTSPNGDFQTCDSRLYVTIDLLANYPITGATIWHYYGDPRRYPAQPIHLCTAASAKCRLSRV